MIDDRQRDPMREKEASEKSIDWKCCPCKIIISLNDDCEKAGDFVEALLKYDDVDYGEILGLGLSEKE